MIEFWERRAQGLKGWSGAKAVNGNFVPVFSFQVGSYAFGNLLFEPFQAKKIIEFTIGTAVGLARCIHMNSIHANKTISELGKHQQTYPDHTPG